MAVDLQLQLTKSSGGVFTFDIEGQPTVSVQRFFKSNANPPELERIVETWSIEGARITGTSMENTFDQWNAFMVLVDTRTGNRFTSAAVVRDPSGDNATERTLGPSTYQEFRVESVEMGPDPIPELEGARWRSMVPVDLTLVGARLFADGNGITTWEQTIINTWQNGLHRQEMRTHIETVEGAATAATALAETYAVIDIASLGNTYTWATNSPEDNGKGCEITINDADEANSRVGTSIDCVSIVQKHGIQIGTPNAGESINEPISLSTETRVEGAETETITKAEAHGPGARAWVVSKAPGGPYKSSSVIEDTAQRGAWGMWVKGDKTHNNPRVVEATITGGNQDEDLVPISGKFPPKHVVGPVQAYRLVVLSRSTMVAAEPSRLDMLLPPKLDLPWILLRNQSSEDAWPKLIKVGADTSANTWERGCRLVYMSATKPSIGPIKNLFSDSGGQDTYYL